MAEKSIARPIIVGEVLWDCFPDRRVLGGAPFNVAWNLAGFGLDPLMISAVGDDELGHEILTAMGQWGMDTQGIAVVSGAETGTVQVRLDRGEPSYEIVTDVAYDQIPMPAIDFPERAILYHGSLAWRSEPTRQTIGQLRRSLAAELFLDINIREPHFDAAWLEPMLDGADVLKLNADELARVDGGRSEARRAPTDGASSGGAARRQAAGRLIERYRLQQLYVTLGADGAELFDTGGVAARVAAPEPSPMVDAVGAGDAFASVVLQGRLRGRPPEAVLEDAVAFAAAVCTLSGATTRDRAFYDRPFLQR